MFIRSNPARHIDDNFFSEKLKAVFVHLILFLHQRLLFEMLQVQASISISKATFVCLFTLHDSTGHVGASG